MPDDFGGFINNLQGYEKSLQEEYEIAQANQDLETIRTLIENKIAKALPGFVDDLILIARTGDTDSSRLKAIQFAFNWYFKESTSADDPFSALLTQLTSNDNDPANPPPPDDSNPHLRETPDEPTV
jgi:hypothetical protein